MSCSYADGLSPYHDKGKLGLAEQFDSFEEVQGKVKILADWINQSKHVVIHTGAGISTTAGIPDFRGPKGVWTLEEKGEKPVMNVSFNEAIPTKTHMAIVKLVQTGKVQFVISQNIDGLHLRSGLPRKHLAELHGNMFIEQCHGCQRQFVRNIATSSVGQKCLEKPCPMFKSNGRPCRGKLHDIILDWEHDLPEKDLGLADFHSCLADLSICLGTTLQIVPSGTLPLSTKKYNSGKLVICNLQPTKYDKKADLLIHTYVDDIMVSLMNELNLNIPEFDLGMDPSRFTKRIPVEWTIPDSEVKRMRTLYERNCCKTKKKRKIKDEYDEEKPQIELKPLIKSKEPDTKISKVSEDLLLKNVKQEPYDIAERKEGTCDISSGIKQIENESKENLLEPTLNVELERSTEDESIVMNLHKKANELPFCQYDELNESSSRQIYHEPDSIKSTTSEISEKSYDDELNNSTCIVNKEIISC